MFNNFGPLCSSRRKQRLLDPSIGAKIHAHHNEFRRNNTMIICCEIVRYDHQITAGVHPPRQIAPKNTILTIDMMEAQDIDMMEAQNIDMVAEAQITTPKTPQSTSAVEVHRVFNLRDADDKLRQEVWSFYRQGLGNCLVYAGNKEFRVIRFLYPSVT